MGGYEDAYERDGDTRWLKVEMGGQASRSFISQVSMSFPRIQGFPSCEGHLCFKAPP